MGGQCQNVLRTLPDPSFGMERKLSFSSGLRVKDVVGATPLEPELPFTRSPSRGLLPLHPSPVQPLPNQHQVQPGYPASNSFVFFNVGGQRFTCHSDTLVSRGENFLSRLVAHERSGSLSTPRDHKGYLLIDRSPAAFSHVMGTFSSDSPYFLFHYSPSPLLHCPHFSRQII